MAGRAAREGQLRAEEVSGSIEGVPEGLGQVPSGDLLSDVDFTVKPEVVDLDAKKLIMIM